MLGHSGFEIIADYLQRHSFKEVQHINVTSKPSVHFHVQTRLDIGVTAIGQDSYEQINLMFLTVGVKAHGFARPIDFAAYSGLTDNMACKLMLFHIVAVIRTELGIFDRYFIFHTSFSSIFLPQQLQRNSDPAQLRMNFPIVRFGIKILIEIFILMRINELINFIFAFGYNIPVRNTRILGYFAYFIDHSS